MTTDTHKRCSRIHTPAHMFTQSFKLREVSGPDLRQGWGLCGERASDPRARARGVCVGKPLGCHWWGKDALGQLCGATGVTDDAGRWSPSDQVSAGNSSALPSNHSLLVPTWPPWGRFCRVARTI
uniref:Uncharacterized protein n=1 Tax=Myotis myotis TaxID=51298 RepID=A0A7J7SC65_MYOMY|nr:hypothetical protein mMyoMyo1_009537 [Myotis myotis]